MRATQASSTRSPKGDMHPSARGQFSPAGGTTYLNTAGYGLPPRATVNACADALWQWSSGTADWVTDWDAAGDRCRALAASFLGGTAEDIALVPAVSVAVGVIMSSVPTGAEVLVPENEFASVVLPALVAAESRGVILRRAPVDGLADAVTERTRLVLTSQVRSSDGCTADLEGVAAAARAVGAALLVDATHAAGVLPVDADRLGIDFVVAAAYKHLLCPRGVAFLRIAPERLSQVPPILASWRSADAPYVDYCDRSLASISRRAARLDVSLAWHSWVGAEASLRFLASVPGEERARWCGGLATAFSNRLGIPATGSSIVSVPVTSVTAARRACQASRLVASWLPHAARISFHLYNGLDDALMAAALLEPFVDRRPGTRVPGRLRQQTTPQQGGNR